MVEQKLKYNSFSETFKISSFGLAVNMMYPEPKNEKYRFTIATFMLMTFIPGLICFIFEFYHAFSSSDFDNVTRQITLAIPFTTVPFKMLLANYKRKEFSYLLTTISSDMIEANGYTEDLKAIVDKLIISGKRGQHFWTFASIVVSTIFPIMAMLLMVHHNLTHDETKRYMIHEVDIPGLGDRKYDSPYFEIMFAYMMYLVWYFQASFTGFDGTFCICANHGTMKLKLLSRKLRNIFEQITDMDDLKRGLKNLIEEHQNIYEFLEELQCFYDPWLAIVFVLSLVQICTTLYQITENDEIDPKYMILVVGSVCHIYVPCHYSAVLKQTAIDTSTEIYCCGWDQVMDKWTTDTIRFMIARAQRIHDLSALGMVNFDMLLFLSMCQTSYSMFTLITSK